MMTTPKQEYHIKTNKLAKLFCAPILLITKASLFHVDATSWLKCLSSSGWRDLNPGTVVWEGPSCRDSKIVNYLRTQSDERSLFSVDAEYRQYVRQHFSQLFPAFHHRRSCLLPRSLDGREFFYHHVTKWNSNPLLLFYSKETSLLRHLRSAWIRRDPKEDENNYCWLLSLATLPCASNRVGAQWLHFRPQAIGISLGCD